MHTFAFVFKTIKGYKDSKFYAFFHCCKRFVSIDNAKGPLIFDKAFQPQRPVTVTLCDFDVSIYE